MRLEVDLIEGGGNVAAPDLPLLPIARRRHRLAWFELSALALFGLLSLSILAPDLWQVVAHGQVWTGTDGEYVVDQLQTWRGSGTPRPTGWCRTCSSCTGRPRTTSSRRS